MLDRTERALHVYCALFRSTPYIGRISALLATCPLGDDMNDGSIDRDAGSGGAHVDAKRFYLPVKLWPCLVISQEEDRRR